MSVGRVLQRFAGHIRDETVRLQLRHGQAYARDRDAVTELAPRGIDARRIDIKAQVTAARFRALDGAHALHYSGEHRLA